MSDADLLSRLVSLARAEREATVELVVHLAELDARRLYLGQGYGSLFSYCTGALRLAEHAAYNRIEVARACREFPALLDLLVDGSLNLATARLLAPHLQPDNFDALVAVARGKSKREVEVLVARIAPRPDVPSSIRKLPGCVPPVAPGPVAIPSGQERSITEATRADAHSPAIRPGAAVVEIRPAVSLGTPPSASQVTVGRPAARPLVAPLAPARYRVQFTVGEGTHEKLRRVQDLLRREIPDGDPGAIFDRALTLLLEVVAREKLAQTSKPRPPAAAGSTGRHIPASVKRAVWIRDGGRCAFVADDGRRCSARAFLEFHHCEPYAIGGATTVTNVSLRCRGHHALETELAFGPRMTLLERGPGGEGRKAGGEGRKAGGARLHGGRVDSPRGELKTSCLGQSPAMAMPSALAAPRRRSS